MARYGAFEGPNKHTAGWMSPLREKTLTTFLVYYSLFRSPFSACIQKKKNAYHVLKAKSCFGCGNARKAKMSKLLGSHIYIYIYLAVPISVSITS